MSEDDEEEDDDDEEAVDDDEDEGEVEEDSERCPDYDNPRRSMMADVRMVIDRSPIGLNAVNFDAMSQEDHCRILLGQRIGRRPGRGKSD